MNSNRMREVAAYARKYGVSKTVKDLLTMKGNGRCDYSFTENLQKCRRAVICAVKWQKSDMKRTAIKNWSKI